MKNCIHDKNLLTNKKKGNTIKNLIHELFII